MNREINPEYLKHWINATPDTSNLRATILFGMLFLIDFLMVAPLYADPYEAIYLQVMIPPIVLLNVWGLWIAIAPYKNQVIAELYMGILGVFMPLGYGVCSIKLFYSVLGFTTPMYAIGLLALAVAGYYALFKSHFQKLASGYYYQARGQNGGSQKYVSLSGLGVFLGNLILGMASGNTVIGILTGLCLLLAAMLSLLSLNIHRYVLMKRYPELTVIQRKPVKKTEEA